MTVPQEEVSANYVPAAAVIRRRRALSGVTGRKGCAGGGSRGEMKSPGLPGRMVARRDRLRVGEGRGIPGGAVKCVEIRRNTDGAGSALAARWGVRSLGGAGPPDAEARKLGEQTGLDTLVVPALNDVHPVVGVSTPSLPKLTC